MSLYAEIKDNVVMNIIVADKDFIDLLDGNYVEYTLETPLIGYVASIGFTYDEGRHAFIAPKSNCHTDQILDEITRRWVCENAEHEAKII